MHAKSCKTCFAWRLDFICYSQYNIRHFDDRRNFVLYQDLMSDFPTNYKNKFSDKIVVILGSCHLS